MGKRKCTIYIAEHRPANLPGTGVHFFLFGADCLCCQTLSLLSYCQTFNVYRYHTMSKTQTSDRGSHHHDEASLLGRCCECIASLGVLAVDDLLEHLDLLLKRLNEPLLFLALLGQRFLPILERRNQSLLALPETPLCCPAAKVNATITTAVADIQHPQRFSSLRRMRAEAEASLSIQALRTVRL